MKDQRREREDVPACTRASPTPQTASAVCLGKTTTTGETCSPGPELNSNGLPEPSLVNHSDRASPTSVGSNAFHRPGTKLRYGKRRYRTTTAPPASIIYLKLELSRRKPFEIAQFTYSAKRLPTQSCPIRARPKPGAEESYAVQLIAAIESDFSLSISRHAAAMKRKTCSDGGSVNPILQLTYCVVIE